MGAPTRLAGSLAGAIALITGSTVGAGMLALPAVTAPAGLVPTAASLCGCWVLLTLEALLIAEVNIAVHEERGEADASSIITLRQMAESTLGSPGKCEWRQQLLLPSVAGSDGLMPRAPAGLACGQQKSSHSLTDVGACVPGVQW